MRRGPEQLMILLLAVAACEAPFEPPSGTIRVITATTGSDIDPDGYAVQLDGTPVQALAPNDTIMFSDQVIGRHDVALSNVAVNCAVAGGIARQVNVTTGTTVDVVFSASCTLHVGALRVTTTTSGADLDPDGYFVSVDGGPGVAIPVAGTLDIPNVPVGAHTVALIDLAGNCTAGAPNPRVVNVSYATLSTTAFAITCAAVTGSVRVVTTTTGFDFDPDGYVVDVDGATGPVAPVNGGVTLPGLSPGPHAITLTGSAPNCAVAAPNPDTVTVAVGATDTVGFAITCSAITGSIQVTLATTGSNLDPDGYTVLADYTCDSYWGYCYYRWSEPVGVNDTLTISGVPEGDRIVMLDGVAANCTVAGANRVTTNVVVLDTARVAFAVSCVPTGNVEVTVVTSGVDLPTGYGVLVDGGGQLPVSANGTVTFAAIPEGDHAFELVGVPAHCQVGGSNPVTLHVTANTTTSTTFQVTCTAQYGVLAVAVATTGSSLDPNGFTVAVDSVCDYYYGCYAAWSVPVAVNDTVRIPDVTVGTHTVWLSDLEPNCTVTGANPVTTFVPSADTARVAFTVACVPTGSVAVTGFTGGVDLPSGYGLQVDGLSSGFLPANGTVTLRHILEGDHTVGLVGVASNCSVFGSNPVAVHVMVDDTVRITFQVVCTSAFGTLAVAVTTSGSNLDPDGYTVAVDSVCDYYYGCYAVWTEPAAVNDTVVIANVPIGTHTVWLDGVAPGCGVAGPNPETATVPSADTARVAFTVACTAAASSSTTSTERRGVVRADPIAPRPRTRGDPRRRS